MTTGEYLVSKSSLATGTALDHFLSMQGGAETPVFVSFMSAVIEEKTATAVLTKSTQGSKANGLADYSSDLLFKDAFSSDRSVEISVHPIRPLIFVQSCCDEITIKSVFSQQVFCRHGQ